MGGVILENLSGKKLTVLISILLVCQLVCFLIGGLIAPPPSSVDTALATKCVHNKTGLALYSRGCKSFRDSEAKSENSDIVYAFQLPLPRGTILDYSRWQQYLIGDLGFDILFMDQYKIGPDAPLTMDATIAYRNLDDAEDDWKVYASSKIQTTLHCVIDLEKSKEQYTCQLVPLFQLGSLFHDFYLVNIYIAVDNNGATKNYNLINDLWLTVINQNGGFTKVWLSMKCTFLFFITAIMLWSWNRVHSLHRPPVLLEYALLTLGVSLILLNVPVEMLTLIFDLPFMPLLQDVRQGIFYASLLSFWLIFSGEHMMIQDPQPRHIKTYWKHLSGVIVGCLSLFIYDIFEKGAQIKNPFYSIWTAYPNLASIFLVCAAFSACVYFIFLCYMILKVFVNISTKRSTLSNMSNVRKLHYEGIIYRFNFLMLVTIICAATTIGGFIMGQAEENHWRWSDKVQIEYISAFFTGVYGMWNIYIFALIILYSPSHKHWHLEADTNGFVDDEIKLNNSFSEPNEISLLTLATKQSNE